MRFAPINHDWDACAVSVAQWSVKRERIDELTHPICVVPIDVLLCGRGADTSHFFHIAPESAFAFMSFASCVAISKLHPIALACSLNRQDQAFHLKLVVECASCRVSSVRVQGKDDVLTLGSLKNLERKMRALSTEEMRAFVGRDAMNRKSNGPKRKFDNLFS